MNVLKTKKSRRTKPPAAQSGTHRRAGKYLLRLFVAGATARSLQAIVRVRELCETELRGRYTLEVVDIYQQPALARSNQIVATPTLIKELPRPMSRFIGNLTNLTGLLGELNLVVKDKIAI